LRRKYVKGSLVVGEEPNGHFYILNPAQVTKDGEWEAWLLGPKLPGAYRFTSFAELVVFCTWKTLSLVRIRPGEVLPMRAAHARKSFEEGHPQGPSGRTVQHRLRTPLQPPPMEGSDDGRICELRQAPGPGLPYIWHCQGGGPGRPP
jgi:hypothetical protein